MNAVEKQLLELISLLFQFQFTTFTMTNNSILSFLKASSVGHYNVTYTNKQGTLSRMELKYRAMAVILFYEVSMGQGG